VSRLIAFCTICLVALASAGTAQTNINLSGMAVDRSAAIEVTSQTLSVDQDTSTAVFNGDVLVIQGDLRVTAAQVTVIYGDDTSQIARLVATGGVTFVTPQDAAEAQDADYDITTGFLTLTGDVLLTQGASAITAQSMVINVADGTATMQGRVRTILNQADN
jgi:lipopolysaccharide export system protein LptA